MHTLLPSSLFTTKYQNAKIIYAKTLLSKFHVFNFHLELFISFRFVCNATLFFKVNSKLLWANYDAVTNCTNISIISINSCEMIDDSMNSFDVYKVWAVLRCFQLVLICIDTIYAIHQALRLHFKLRGQKEHNAALDDHSRFSLLFILYSTFLTLFRTLHFA